MLDDTKEASQTILVADDEPSYLGLIKLCLERSGYLVVTAEDGFEAIVKARSVLPALVILDVMMPGMSGLEACRIIKEDKATHDIPIIFLSARSEIDLKVYALGQGSNDYISKPFTPKELLARVHVALRLKRERDDLHKIAEEANAYAKSERNKAVTDPLTGLLNRYGLQVILGNQLAQARRYGKPVSCLMIDVDKFKVVNDTYGHPSGDAALRQVAGILKEAVRGSDVVFRYGGEEFMVLLPDTMLEGAVGLAEKIRMLTASHPFGEGQRIFFLTLSVGAAVLREGESGSDMIMRADAALYRAKALGRNRVDI
ncbi:MAG: diguanylate cyclase [Pyrinomonadaceae bacterium]|nr:diguanylate cyclase [Pyrinomonadaceae bacterium]